MAPTTKKEPITFEEALVKLNLISPAELDLAKIEANKKKETLEQVLQEMGLVSGEDIIKAWAEVYGLSYVDLKDKKVAQEILYQIPEQVAKNYRLVAFDKKDNRLFVAIENPKNLQALEALEFIKEKNNFAVDLFVASSASIQFVLDQYGTLTGEVGKTLEEIPIDLNVDEVAKEKVESAVELEKVVAEAPISKLVAILIKYASSARASDIHIEPQENKIIVRYRIDGVLQPTLELPKHIHPALVSRIKILSNLKIDETRLPQDGRFHTIVGNKKIDFRVSTLPTSNGEKVVMRLLEKTAGLLTTKQLGLAGRALEVVEEAIKKPHGMLLVCGPTGSGKTTTLYALLQELNKPGVNIVTLEDPIEYKIEGINQSQINPEINFTFANGLRSILRQDPDIVMVGEIRDFETAEMAVHAALTGHLLLSTLHTNDAAGAIPRLIDMRVEPFLIASTVNAILSQRLVRKICPDCKESYSPSTKEIALIEEEIKKMPPQVQKGLKLPSPLILYRGKKCGKCNQTGYQGRLGIFEALKMTEAIEVLTLKRASASDIAQVAINEGMLTLRQDGFLKALAGITSLEEVLRVTSD